MINIIQLVIDIITKKSVLYTLLIKIRIYYLFASVNLIIYLMKMFFSSINS